MNVISSVKNTHSKPKHQLTTSRSPDHHRQKLPAFKPKTLNEIYNQTLIKKSTDDLQKYIKSKNNRPIQKKEQNNNQKEESKKGQIKLEQKMINNNKKQKNSLVDFIKQSGHAFQVQSQELQNSQYDDDFNMQQWSSPQKKLNQQKINKYQPLTPQLGSFSKNSIRQHNPFEWKDDSYLRLKSQKEQRKLWNGQITLSTSICYDEGQNDQIGSQKVLDQQMRIFIFENRFYMQCTNVSNGNQYLFDSSQRITLQSIIQQLKLVQKRSKKLINQTKLEIVLLGQKIIQNQEDRFETHQNVILSQLSSARVLKINYKVVLNG